MLLIMRKIIFRAITVSISITNTTITGEAMLRTRVGAQWGPFLSLFFSSVIIM